MSELLLLDVGNTHTHLGLANRSRVFKQGFFSTQRWSGSSGLLALRRFVRKRALKAVAICSVVPRLNSKLTRTIQKQWGLSPHFLTAASLRGVGIDYLSPQTIGPDRLANALAVKMKYGAPSVVVDFGTAVTFDVVNAEGNYSGGIIAPGLSAMTEYLHEKTALLPKIKIREVRAIVGKNTEEAMLIGAVHGYRGLVQHLLHELRLFLRDPHLPVVATGGDARLIAAKLQGITAIDEGLTLEGLRLFLKQCLPDRPKNKPRRRSKP